MLPATVKSLQAEACLRQQAVPGTAEAMAGERMVGICCGNMLPMEWHVVKAVGLWSLPVLCASLLVLLEGHPVPIWELLVFRGPPGDRMSPAAH